MEADGFGMLHSGRRFVRGERIVACMGVVLFMSTQSAFYSFHSDSALNLTPHTLHAGCNN